MKHAVIVAHPKPQSLSSSAATAYVDTVLALGHTAIVRDLYRMDFDPRLQAGEIPSLKGFRAAPDVEEERRILRDVDVLAFVYPFWFNAPPAILKGYVDRVFGMGFGFGPGLGGTEPLLEGRKLISISFSGAPEQWVQDTGAWSALTTLFDQHLGRMCGLTVLDHLHYGGISPELNAVAADEILNAIKSAMREQFEESGALAATEKRSA